MHGMVLNEFSARTCAARLASFHCNGRPRARAPIIITIITANVHANAKNSGLCVRCTTRMAWHACKPCQEKKAKAKRSHWSCRRQHTHGMAKVCEGMAEVREGAPEMSGREQLGPHRWERLGVMCS